MPLLTWLDDLPDRRAQLRIVARLRRVSPGLVSDAGGLVAFDPVRYLTDDEAIAAYVAAVLEIGDAELLVAALEDVARARGRAEVSRSNG